MSTTKKATKKAQPLETPHRVMKLPLVTRKALKAARAEHGTNLAAINYAVESRLPPLLRELERLGVGAKTTGAACKSYRLPIGPKSLAALKRASEATGLDQSLLLKVLLADIE